MPRKKVVNKKKTRRTNRRITNNNVLRANQKVIVMGGGAPASLPQSSVVFQPQQPQMMNPYAFLPMQQMQPMQPMQPPQMPPPQIPPLPPKQQPPNNPFNFQPQRTPPIKPLTPPPLKSTILKGYELPYSPNTEPIASPTFEQVNIDLNQIRQAQKTPSQIKNVPPQNVLGGPAPPPVPAPTPPVPAPPVEENKNGNNNFQDEDQGGEEVKINKNLKYGVGDVLNKGDTSSLKYIKNGLTTNQKGNSILKPQGNANSDLLRKVLTDNNINFKNAPNGKSGKRTVGNTAIYIRDKLASIGKKIMSVKGTLMLVDNNS